MSGQWLRIMFALVSRARSRFESKSYAREQVRTTVRMSQTEAPAMQGESRTDAVATSEVDGSGPEPAGAKTAMERAEVLKTC